MIKTTRSLLRRIVLGQLMVVIGFCVLAFANLFWNFYNNGEGEFDQSATMPAKLILKVIDKAKDNPVVLRERLMILSEVNKIQNKQIAAVKGHALTDDDPPQWVRIFDKTGAVIFSAPSYSDTRPTPWTSTTFPTQGRTEFVHNGKQWHGYSESNADGSLTVHIAITTAYIADELFSTTIRFILLPLLVFIPFATAIIWLVAARSLKPLQELADVISQRSPNDMKPVVDINRYKETAPIVDEINLLLTKLDNTLTRERNFLADAAHELRTPLAVIQAQSHVMKHASEPAEKECASAELSAGIERAANLIQKLLMTARVSVTDFVPRFELTDLCVFAQERIARFSVLAANRDIDLELSAPHRCYVKIDRETLGAAIDNVLDNAIRYTPLSGAVLVSISTLENGRVRFRISDNGVGIPEELHERVFERFYRVPGTEAQGSGLGLAIAKRVLALHHGQLILSNGSALKGLTIDFMIPVGV